MKPNWTCADALRATGVFLLGSMFVAAVMLVGQEMGIEMGSEDRAELLVGLVSTLGGMLMGLWYAHRKAGMLAFVWGRMSHRWMLQGVALAIVSIGLGWVWGWLVEALAGDIPDQQVIVQIASLEDPLLLAFAGLYITVAAPVLEEYLFRGFFQPPFVERFGHWGGITITAVAFGLMHISDPWVVPGVTLIGMLAGWLREKTGGVGVPIAFHAANNSLAMALYALSGIG